MGILTILETVFVMIKLTMINAAMMGEIAVDQIETQLTALNVNIFAP